MRNTRSIILAGMVLVVLSLSGGALQAALDNAMVGTYGTATFTGSGGNDPDATVDYVVIYRSGGVRYSDLNTVLDTGALDLDSDDDDVPGNGDGSAYDESKELTFLYQIDGVDGGAEDDVERLYIKDYGFTPNTAGYFGNFTMSFSGTAATLAADANTVNPGDFDAGRSFDDANGDSQGAVAWEFDDNPISDTKVSSILFMQFSEATHGVTGTGWVTNYSNLLTGDNRSTYATLPSPNPEPGSLALLGAAVAGFGGFRRFRRRRNAEQHPEETEAGTATTPEVD